jgi:acyl-CoA reductase-like NAD-dependent aldehyde dehydrogenase
VAVATEREYGLFINGELVEPQAGEIRELTEPATGELLARAAMAGEADVDRAKSVLVSTSSKPFNPFGL